MKNRLASWEAKKLATARGHIDMDVAGPMSPSQVVTCNALQIAGEWWYQGTDNNYRRVPARLQAGVEPAPREVTA